MKEKKKDRQRNGYLAAAAGLLYAVLTAVLINVVAAVTGCR